MTSSASITERAEFDFVRYASVWEDARVLGEALAPVASAGRLLAIASAGDNVLSLLTLDPERIVAVDLSPAQIACVELRLAAFRRLGHEEILAFLGVTPAPDRERTYASLRSGLPEAARWFWDLHPEAIRQGAIHMGKFERYFQTFRKRVLPCLHQGRGTVAELAGLSDPGAQRAFYRFRWDSWRWRLLFRVFFSRAVMGRFGRDPAFFDQVEGPVGERILERTKHALTEIPAVTNPYLQYILTGNFTARALPEYLKPENHDLIHARLDRIVVERGAAHEVKESGFDGLALSDIFEYMSGDEFASVYDALLRKARGGARLVYWNMLVPRSGAERYPKRARRLVPFSDELHAKDRAWFYSRLHVDEALAEGAGP